MKAVVLTIVGSYLAFLGCANLQAEMLAFDPKGDLFALGGYEVFKYQLALDLSSDFGSYAASASVVWAPDSKRLAINYHGGSHVEATNLYQLRRDRWVRLASPVDATYRILERAKSAEKRKKDKSEETSGSFDFDSWMVERWTDADTAVLYAHLRVSDYLFVFTLGFDKGGNWKIVNQAKESPEK
jgi:hypothetical protein